MQHRDETRHRGRLHPLGASRVGLRKERGGGDRGLAGSDFDVAMMDV